MARSQTDCHTVCNLAMDDFCFICKKVTTVWYRFKIVEIAQQMARSQTDCHTACDLAMDNFFLYLYCWYVYWSRARGQVMGSQMPIHNETSHRKYVHCSSNDCLLDESANRLPYYLKSSWQFFLAYFQKITVDCFASNIMKLLNNSQDHRETAILIEVSPSFDFKPNLIWQS